MLSDYERVIPLWTKWRRMRYRQMRSLYLLRDNIVLTLRTPLKISCVSIHKISDENV